MASNVVMFPVVVKKALLDVESSSSCSYKYPEELTGTEAPIVGGRGQLRFPLKKNYPSEWDSFRNMKQRVKYAGGEVHPAFGSFQSFLEVMGEKPDSQATLDRIDPTDPEYAPNKVRWASKKVQANNRTNTIYLDFDGVRRPLTDWASRTHTNPDTLRRRYERGWTHKEAITGERDVIEQDRRKHPAVKNHIEDIARNIRTSPKYPAARSEPFTHSLYRAARHCIAKSQALSDGGGRDLSQHVQEATEQAFFVLTEITPLLQSTHGGQLLLGMVNRYGPLKFHAPL